MATQLALLDRSSSPRWDDAFTRLQHRDLGDGAWVEHQPGWLTGHQGLFDALMATTAWRSLQREMYGESVDVPRLVARIPDDGPGHPVLSDLSHALTRRFGRPLERVSLNLYRDGRDSVAPHADKVGDDRLDDSVVAILSLGVPRRFRLKPTRGGRSLHYTLGWGDLFVMGGACQRHWQHGVPKARRTGGARLSVMFRPPRAEGEPRVEAEPRAEAEPRVEGEPRGDAEPPAEPPADADSAPPTAPTGPAAPPSG